MRGETREVRRVKNRALRRGAGVAALYALLAAVLLAGSTFAWFTFRAYTNVTPLAGTIGTGEGDLLISARRDGGFDTQCALPLRDAGAELLPVSTAELEHFFTVSAQDGAGIATAYRNADERAAAHSLNGTVYLKADGSDFDIYLWREDMHCGSDAQALAAMRLGLRIVTASGTRTHIFKLDELGSTASAEAVRTVPEAGKVVSSVGAGGAAVYVNDPAKALSECTAKGTADEVQAGKTALCALNDGEIAEVRFWLYLEGCDENCINSVQGKDIALQLGFAGAQRER